MQMQNSTSLDFILFLAFITFVTGFHSHKHRMISSFLHCYFFHIHHHITMETASILSSEVCELCTVWYKTPSHLNIPKPANYWLVGKREDHDLMRKGNHGNACLNGIFVLKVIDMRGEIQTEYLGTVFLRSGLHGEFTLMPGGPLCI